MSLENSHMHPKENSGHIEEIIAHFFKSEPKAILNVFAQEGLINRESFPFWLKLIQQLEGRNKANLVAQMKLLLDQLAEEDSKFSSKDALQILNNLRVLLNMAANNALFPELTQAKIKDLTALDFGCGIYSPLVVSILMFANGFKRAIALDPFDFRVDYAKETTLEIIKKAFSSPQDFIFTDITPEAFKARLATLDFSNLEQKLSQLNRNEITKIDLNGVELVHSQSTIAENSVDLIFSNSVLEHLPDLASSLQWWQRVLTQQGIACHTVDFADHRYYHDRLNNHPFQKYFDGILKDINGLTPTEMEFEFITQKFSVYKFNKLTLPQKMFFNRHVEMVERYKSFPEAELCEWVNAYLLVNQV
jgi:SAM-dependent methyltransferase